MRKPAREKLEYEEEKSAGMQALRELKANLEVEKDSLAHELAEEKSWEDKLTWGQVHLRGIHKIKADQDRNQQLLVLCNAILELAANKPPH